MANVSSPRIPIYLTWTRSNVRGRYELMANGAVLGSLQRIGFWKPSSHAELQGQSWSFKRSRVANTKVFQEPGASLVAELKANWLGGGMLTFADGRQFQLTAKGFCRPVWSWTDDHGARLVEATPHNKSVVLLGTAAAGNCWSDRYLPVLVMLSWHQILQANDDAAAIAASAAAG
jgi:hypothetical protein